MDNGAIFTVIDMFSKFLFTAPLKNEATETVADALVDIFMRTGLCRAISSDMGLEFQSKLVQDVNKLLGIEHEQLKSTSMKASTQGQVERVHRTMHAMFAKYTTERQHDCVMALPFGLQHGGPFIYFLHSLLHFSRKGRYCSSRPTPDESENGGMHDYALNLTEQLRFAFDFVQRFAHTRIDAHVKPVVFSEGQFVYYYYPRARPNKYHKWQLNYLGVYKIIRVLNSTNCVLQRTPRGKAFIAHFDKLKHYHGNEPEVWKGHRMSGDPVQYRPTVDTGLSQSTCDNLPSPPTQRVGG